MRDAEDEEFLKKLGKKIAELRKEKGWTQEEFAEVLGIHRTAMARIEVGGTNVTILQYRKVMKALGNQIIY